MSLFKILINTIVAVCVSTFLYSQAPPIQWDFRSGSSWNESIHSVCPANDGGFLLCGYTDFDPYYPTSSGDITDTINGGTDMWIVKVDKNGLKDWDKIIGGTGGDIAYIAKQTFDNGFIVGGLSYSSTSGEKTQGNWGKNDYWIVRIDSAGINKWDKRFGGSDWDEILDIHLTADSGFILVGVSYSGISGDRTQDSRGGGDYWVVKLDSTGNKIWDKRFGGNFSDWPYSIIEINGNYLIGGETYSSVGGDISDTNRGYNDFWLLSISSTGNKLWDKRYGGNKVDRMSAICKTQDGGYLLAGTSNSDKSGEKMFDSKGGFDFWVVKVRYNGIKQWDRVYGGSGNEYLSSMELTDDGGFILTGYSNSGISGDKSEVSRGGYDYWMIKLNSFGIKQWDKTFGGSDDDFMAGYYAGLDSNQGAWWDLTSHHFLKCKDGGYMIVGTTKSPISGEQTKYARGGKDFWAVKLRGCAKFNTKPSNLEICKYDNAFFAVGVKGSDTIIYQWQENDGSGWYNIHDTTPYSGTRGDTLLLATLSTNYDNYKYRCIVNNGCGLVTSNSAILTVNTIPNMISNPVDTTICESNNCSFMVSSSGASLLYHWKCNKGTGWFDLQNDSVHTNTHKNEIDLANVPLTYDSFWYRCVVSNQCGMDSSNQASLIVNEALKIENSPFDSGICESMNVIFSTRITGELPIIYMWQYKKDSVWQYLADTGIYSGSNSDSLILTNVSSINNGYEYRAITSNVCLTDTTNIAALTVNTIPLIVSEPSDSTLCENENGSFSVTTNGMWLNYFWQLNEGNGWNYLSDTGIFSGSLSDLLNLSQIPVKYNKSKFRVIADNDCGTDTSYSAMLIIKTPPVISGLINDTSKCEGDYIDFQIINSGSRPINYQWQKNKSDIPGETDSVLVFHALAIMETGKYRNIFTNICGTDTSNEAFLIVNPLPEVDLGKDSSIKINESMILDAGPGFKAYKWNNDSKESTLTIEGSVTGKGDHTFYVIVTDSNNCSNSDTIIITVIDNSGISESDDKTFCKVCIYPNPTSGIINLEVKNQNNRILRIEISDINGHIVYSHEYKCSIKEDIDLSDKARGLYFVKVESGDFLRVGKVILK